MWFKQVQCLQVDTSRVDQNQIENDLDNFAYKPCPPSLPSTQGWVPPLPPQEEDEQEPLLYHHIGDLWVFCLQLEEKVLPASVVNHELELKVKQLETMNDRKLRAKEKRALKDEVTQTLLPRAFSKRSKIMAYMDTRHQWLVIDCVQAKKVDVFIKLLSRSIPGLVIEHFAVKKTTKVMTDWLINQTQPDRIAIEKAAVLQDPRQEQRVIRAKNQDLMATSIQSLIKDGCEVSQLALSWADRVDFMLHEDFTLRSLVYSDKLVTMAKDQYSETAAQRFEADLLIMSEVLTECMGELLTVFAKEPVHEMA